MVCVCGVTEGVIPEWARDGFMTPAPVNPTVGSGRQHRGHRVRLPAHGSGPSSTNNKVRLWVAKWVDGSDLVIDAQRMDGAVPVGSPVMRRVEYGPGPSIVDLPDTGCWRLTLRWAGLVDTLDLEYASPGVVGSAPPS